MRVIRNSRVLVLGVGAVALATLILIYLLHVATRRQYFVDSTLRALSDLSGKIGGTITNLQGAVDNAAGKAPLFEKAVELIPQLTFAPDDTVPSAEHESFRIQAFPFKGWQTAAGQRHTPTDREIFPLSDSYLYFCPQVTGKPAIDKRCAPNKRGRPTIRTRAKPPAHLRCPRTTFSNLVEGIIEGSGLNAMDVFIADEDATVLYKRGDPALRLLKLPKRADTAEQPTPRSHQVTPTPKPEDADTKAQLPSIEELQQWSRVSTVELLGVNYTAFTQPLHIPPHFPGMKGHTWVIGALQPTRVLDEKARKIPLGGSSGHLALFLLLVPLVLPSLKVTTMGPREPFSALDVHVLGLSIVAVTALMTYVALDWYADARLDDEMDEQMRTAARILSTNFHAELERDYDLLKRFTDKRQAQGVKWGCGLENGVTNTDILKPAGELSAVLNGRIDALPAFEMLVLANAKGEQVEKWTSKSLATPLIPIKQYHVFGDPVRRRLLRFPAAYPQADREFALNIQTSPNTAENVALLSIPTSISENETGAAVIVPNLVSVTNAVLPPDLGFAVIENDGNVLFHSNAQRRLAEIFYAECSDDLALRSAIFARRDEFLDTEYHGRPHRLYAHPIPDTPWSVIIFRDKQPLQALDFDIMATCLLMFAVFMLIYLIGIVAAQMLRPRDQGDWLWPNRAHPDAYRDLTLALIGLALWFVWVIYEPDAQALALACVSVPLFALALACTRSNLLTGKLTRTGCALSYGILLIASAACFGVSILRFNVRSALAFAIIAGFGFSLLDRAPSLAKPDSRMLRTVARWYVAVFAVLLVIVAVLPMTALYFVAHEQGMETFVRRGQLNLAKDLAAQEERVRSEYQKLGDSLVATRLADPTTRILTPFTTDRYGERKTATILNLSPLSTFASWPDMCTDYGATATDTMAGELPRIDRGPEHDRTDFLRMVQRHFTAAITAFLPVYDATSLQSREMAYDTASDCNLSDGCRWSWTPTTSRMTVMDPRFDGHSGSRGQIVITTPVPGGLWMSAGAWNQPVPLIWGAVVLMVAYALYTRTGGLLRRIFGLRCEADAPASPDGGTGAVAIMPLHKFHLRPSHSRLVALSAHPNHIDLRTANPTDWTNMVPADRTVAVVVTHLEHRVDNPYWNRAKLELLETLSLPGRHPGQVTSQIDLLDYFGRRLRSPGDPANDENFVTPEELDRWAHVLARFEKIRSDLPDRRVTSLLDLDAIVSSECAGKTEELAALSAIIRQQATNTVAWYTLTRDELITYIADLADAHYRVLWSRCTDEERLVLIHLATLGFVNPNRRSWAIVARLMRRRLIHCGPAFRLMNDSFQKFVRNAEGADRIRQWERAEGASPWDWMRNAVLGLSLIFAALLFITQPDTLTRWLAVLPAMTAGTGAFVQFLGFYQRRVAGRST